MRDRYETTRKRYEDRKARLLNAKQRAMGIDTASLDAKVRANRLAKQRQREEDLAQVALNQTLEGVMREQDVAEAIAAQEQIEALKSDWYHQANRKTRIEADLNPKLVKNQPIDPAQCGVAACQSFMGEDADFQRRKRMQAQQFRQWCELQIEEKKQLKQMEQDEDKQYAAFLKSLDEVRVSQEVEEATVAASRVIEVRDDNKFLAKAKKLQDATAKQEEEQYSQWEVQNQLNDPVLAEDPMQAAAPGLGPTRVRRDHWKGMSQQEVDEIFAFNKLQQEEKAAKRQAEKDEDMNWAAHNDTLKQWVDQQEYDESVLAQEKLYDLVDDRLYQAQDQKAQKMADAEHEKNATNFDEKFFGSFGASAR